MAILFSTGFDHYTNILQRFTTTVNWSAQINNTLGRNGTNGVTVLNNTSGGGAVKTLPSSVQEVYFAFAFRWNGVLPAGSPNAIVDVRDTSTIQCTLTMRPDGTLAVYRGNSSTLIAEVTDFSFSSEVYTHIEWYIKIDNSTGATAVRINEIEKCNETGLDSQTSTNATLNGFSLRATGFNMSLNDFDDIILRTDGWSGDAEVITVFPTGTGGANDWSIVGASTAHEATDESPPNNDTDYIASTTVSHLTLFTYSTIESDSIIHAVTHMPFAKKDDAGSATIAAAVSISNTVYLGDNKAPALDQYEYHPHYFLTNPATGVTWTASDFNSMELGVKRTT